MNTTQPHTAPSAPAKHHTDAAACCDKAAEEHRHAAKCCATGDHKKAGEHAKRAADLGAEAHEHGENAMAA